MTVLKPARALLLGLLISAGSAPVLAVPMMELRADDLVQMASEFRKSLTLTTNQQSLWQQVENRSKQLLRERKARRERLQENAKTALAGKGAELRDMTAALEAEEAASAAEDKQLREWWLSVNDALDDGQRQAVASFLGEVLIRVEGGSARNTGEHPPAAEGSAHRGGHRGGPGGGMGGGTPPGRN